MDDARFDRRPTPNSKTTSIMCLIDSVPCACVVFCLPRSTREFMQRITACQVIEQTSATASSVSSIQTSRVSIRWREVRNDDKEDNAGDVDADESS